MWKFLQNIVIVIGKVYGRKKFFKKQKVKNKTQKQKQRFPISNIDTQDKANIIQTL